MKWYIQVWKKYAVFSGRAHRTEYWMFLLFDFLISLGLEFIDGGLTAASNTNQSVFSTVNKTFSSNSFH